MRKVYLGNCKKFGIARITWKMVKEKKEEKIKNKQRTENEKQNYCLYIYHLLSVIFRKPPHKKRFVLMTDLKDRYHMVLVNKAEK